MENPHAERHAVLLERVVKNVDKNMELLAELNHCIEQVVKANRDVRISANLATKYRKNVQYNLEATRGQDGS